MNTVFRKMRIMGLILLALTFTASLAHAQLPVVTSGTDASAVLKAGVRYFNFASSPANAIPEVYLGRSVALDTTDRAVIDLNAGGGNWVISNHIRFIYQPTSGMLRTVVNVNGTFSANYQVGDLGDLNYLQFDLVEQAPGTNITLANLQLNGQVLGGSYAGNNGSPSWMITGMDLTSGVVFDADIFLSASQPDGDLNKIEIHIGYTTGEPPTETPTEVPTETPTEPPTETPTEVPTQAPNAAPDCSTAYVSPDLLWPPNHQFVPVAIMNITDQDGDPVAIAIDGIVQDEPVDAKGDGSTGPDASVYQHAVALLRAERSGSGNGRIYHIAFTADDGKEGTCSGVVTVGVPKSLGTKGTAIDSGVVYNSMP